MLTRQFVAPALGALVCACGEVADERAVTCAAQPIEVLPNGNFDAADPAWRQDPPTPSQLCSAPTIQPDSGTVAGCMGGFDGLIQTLTQTVPLPAGATAVTLSGKLCIDTDETDPMDRDELTFDLLDGATPIAQIGRRTNQQGLLDCQFEVFTLDAALSRDPVEATLRLRTSLSIDKPTTFFVDTLSLTVSCDP